MKHGNIDRRSKIPSSGIFQLLLNKNFHPFEGVSTQAFLWIEFKSYWEINWMNARYLGSLGTSPREHQYTWLICKDYYFSSRFFTTIYPEIHKCEMDGTEKRYRLSRWLFFQMDEGKWIGRGRKMSHIKDTDTGITKNKYQSWAKLLLEFFSTAHQFFRIYLNV